MGDELVANGLSRDSGLVPAQPGVKVPLLELLADVVGGDVLRPRRPPDLPGDEDGPHGFVRELDESTLHERDDRRVIPVGRNRHLKVRPRRLTVGSTCCVMRCSCLAALFRSHRLSGTRDAPRHPSRGQQRPPERTGSTYALNLIDY